MKRLSTLPLVLVFLACGQDAPATGDAETDAPAEEAAQAAPAASDNPETDVWLASLSDDGLSFSEARNVTDRAGYDSQPFFVDNESFLYTREEGGQTDTWRYDAASDSHSAVTATEDSEFAPMPLPSGDGFSAVRREADGQWRVWRYDAEGQPVEAIFDVSRVDFYAWADENHAFLYVLGEPATMQLATVGEERSSVLAQEVGRSMQKVPGQSAVSWVEVTDVDSEIMTWAVDDPLSRLIAEGVELSEDHAWTPGGMLLQPSGNVVHGWLPDGEGWRVIGSIPQGLAISRISVSPDGAHIAMAAHPAD